MNVPINLILLVLILSIALILIYLRISNKIDIFEPIKNNYREFNRGNKAKNFINTIGKQPQDAQKAVFKEGLILFIVIFIMFAAASKAIFFSAVVSGSMIPTFHRGDLLLMQNVDRTYRVGDIVMFRTPDTDLPYTHRIQSITNEGIMTKGDATDQNDWWKLKNEEILAKAILIKGKPIVLKGYGNYFIISDKNQDFGPFGNDYRKYQLFFQVVRIYGYVIAAVCLFLYILITARKKSWQD
jgi:signal peptidase